MPRSNGSTGSIIVGCWSRSVTCRRRSWNWRIIASRKSRPWRPDSNKRVSGEPGAVQSVTGRRLLALNVGSTTLKGAVYALPPAGSREAPHVMERARAEIPIGDGPQAGLAALFETLSEPAHGPDVVVHRIVHGGDLRDARELDDNLLPACRGTV